MQKRRMKRAAVAAAVIGGSWVVSSGGAGAIVGGADAATTPWQVSLQSGGGHFCGGSVISDRVILTAAHCVEGSGTAGLEIVAGTSVLGDPSAQRRGVATIAVGDGGDVAVLVLSEPLVLGGAVQAIGLASPAEISSNTTATVTGWGARSENDGGTDVLQQVSVPIVDDDTCAAQLGIDGSVELCAGGQGADSCYGDSGGPLVVLGTDGNPKLAGVVSWGEECAGATPGVYAEVPPFTDWVAAALADPNAVIPDAGDPVWGEFEDEWDDEWDDGSFDDPTTGGDEWDDAGFEEPTDGEFDDSWGDGTEFEDEWDDEAEFDDTWTDDDGFDDTWTEDDGYDDSWDDSTEFDDSWEDGATYDESWGDEAWCDDPAGEFHALLG